MRSGIEALWSRWKAVAHRIAAIQVRVVLALLYFTILLPFALILRLTSNPFRIPGWQRYERAEGTESDRARRQF